MGGRGLWAIIFAIYYLENVRPCAALPGRRHCVLSFLNKPVLCLAVVAVLFGAGCSRMPSVPGLTPYKIDIQQGNYVTQDMVEKLKPGMNKSQVRFALGTPLVTDPFHNDRWDYVYVLQKKGVVTEQRRIVVVFSDDKLVRVDGDVKPAPSTGSGQAPSTGTGLGPEKPVASK